VSVRNLAAGINKNGFVKRANEQLQKKKDKEFAGW